MPFTPSHAVVALPFLRTPLVPAAIAVGAMMPDLPLFFRVGLSYGVTHDWWGALYADLPIALGLFILWRVLLRPAVPAISPRWLRERWPAEWSDGPADGWRGVWRGGAVGVLLLVASLLIGIASHVFWDLFTHPARWGSEVFPALAERWGPLDGTQWLQHASSAFGLIVIAIWGIAWLRKRHPEPRPVAAPPWLAPVFSSVAVGALVVSAVLELAVHGIPDSHGFTQAAFRWGTAAGAVILIAAVLTAVAAALWRSRRLPA